MFRLLDRYRGRNVICPDSRRPFLAHGVKEETLEVAEGHEELPEAGWLVGCPSYGHTEVVADDAERRTHCSLCGTALGDPRGASRKLRKRETPS